MTTELVNWVQMTSRRLDAACDMLEITPEVMRYVVMGAAKIEDFGPKLQAEIDEKLGRILPLLQSEDRRIIELRLRGHSFEAIARIMKIRSVPSAERLILRAVRSFRAAAEGHI